MIKVTAKNERELIGQKFELVSIPKHSLHYGEDYTKNWIGRKFTLMRLGGLLWDDGGRATIQYGFEVKPVKTQEVQP